MKTKDSLFNVYKISRNDRNVTATGRNEQKSKSYKILTHTSRHVVVTLRSLREKNLQCKKIFYITLSLKLFLYRPKILSRYSSHVFVNFLYKAL